MVIPVITGKLGTVPKPLIRGLEEFGMGRQTETIEIRALLRSGRIPRRVLET